MLRHVHGYDFVGSLRYRSRGDDASGADITTASHATRTPASVAQRTTAPKASVLVRSPVEAGVALWASFCRHSVVVSTKTTVVASRPSLATAIARKLRLRTGVNVSVASAADDIGVETSAGHRRVHKTLRARAAKFMMPSKS